MVDTNNQESTDVDKEEYQSVFKVFDKNDTGKITINQVNEFINRFEQIKIGPENSQTEGTNAKGEFLNGKPVNKAATNGYAQTTQSQNNRINAKASPNKRGSTFHDQTQQQFAKGRGGPQQQQYAKHGTLGNASNKNEDNNEDTKNQNDATSPQNNSTQNQLIEPTFPNGEKTLQFDEFFSVINDSVKDPESAENYLVYAFSMFDREKKGYINTEDLKVVFNLLDENVTDEEVSTMIKIAGVKSHDKINFKEFVDFFNKKD